jgi:hypothetical protein
MSQQEGTHTPYGQDPQIEDLELDTGNELGACSLNLREERERFNLAIPAPEMEELRRLRYRTKARSITSVIRYALLVLSILTESRGTTQGWELCWVKNGKARKITLPGWHD